MAACTRGLRRQTQREHTTAGSRRVHSRPRRTADFDFLYAQNARPMAGRSAHHSSCHVTTTCWTGESVPLTDGRARVSNFAREASPRKPERERYLKLVQTTTRPQLRARCWNSAGTLTAVGYTSAAASCCGSTNSSNDSATRVDDSSSAGAGLPLTIDRMRGCSDSRGGAWYSTR